AEQHGAELDVLVTAEPQRIRPAALKAERGHALHRQHGEQFGQRIHGPASLIVSGRLDTHSGSMKTHRP
ncbi:hypothetical protein CEE86_14155, partial [Lactobacillus crispatus]